MNIIISPKVGFESASKLAKMLGWKYENPYETGNRDFLKYNIVFKYGFSRPIKTKKGSLTLNKTKAIEIARDKIKVFQALDKNLLVPFTQNKEVAQYWTEHYTVVARSLSKSNNSKGITFCETEEEVGKAEACFWTRFVKHTHEFRINVWKDQVLSIYNKTNNGKHFKFTLFKGAEEHPQLVQMVKEVYNKIQLDFYGLDVLRTEDGTLKLLEVNSAPILFPYTIKKLTTIINKETNNDNIA